MNASHSFETLRRPPVVIALALAAALGAGAWLLAEELTTHVRPVSTVSVQASPRALDTARVAIDTAMEVAIPAATAGDQVPALNDSETPGAMPTALAPAAAPEDPYAILQPVDPAEALFGDHIAVRVSND